MLNSRYNRSPWQRTPFSLFHGFVLGFIALVFVLMLCMFGFYGYIAYKGADAIKEGGVKGLLQQVYCGKDSTCKLPRFME